MNTDALLERLRRIIEEPLPTPGTGHTAERHYRLMQVGREDLSLARLAEAHWDAIAILHEAGRTPAPHALYGVWASEIPGQALRLDAGAVCGEKMFCSGGNLLDHALITVGSTEPTLMDVDLRKHAQHLRYDDSGWKTSAFAETRTSTVSFDSLPVTGQDAIGGPGWYLRRPGFWHGACGPAACWAGGALGLVDYARVQKRRDPHSLAHLGAMEADGWALQAFLLVAGNEIDAHPSDTLQARMRALTVRHLVEQTCTDMLRRFARAYGPRPLAMEEESARRYQELDLYLRQSHAERDLESLGGSVHDRGPLAPV